MDLVGRERQDALFSCLPRLPFLARRVQPPDGPLVGLTPVASLEFALELIVLGTYRLRAWRTSARGAFPGPTGFSPISGPFGGLAC